MLEYFKNRIRQLVDIRIKYTIIVLTMIERIYKNNILYTNDAYYYCLYKMIACILVL